MDKLNSEKEFHDNWASTIDVDAINIHVAFEGATAPENRWILSRMGNLTGKYMLDLGCGAGESSVYFSLKGARCLAGDYSPGMAETTKRLARRYGIELEVRTVNAMKLDFAENTFDIVYAANLLHHVDKNRALREIHRVLKPGGIAALWDPLRHNPLINIYRRLASKVRTPEEQALSIQYIDDVKEIFAHVEYDTFWLATLWIFVRFYLVERIDPNKERYWKKIYYDEPRLRRTYTRLEKLDKVLKKVPMINRFAWNIAVVATK